MSLILAFILGAITGSFLNVCIHRIPRGESLLAPPSHCPSCNHTLGLIDLVPLWSYIRTGGKCRYCKAPISARYPVVEILSALLGAGLVHLFGWTPATLAYGIFTACMMVVAFIDLQWMVIPDNVLMAALVVVLLLHLFEGTTASAALGFAAGALVLYILRFFSSAVYKTEAMGLGDVKLASTMGAALGLRLLLPALLLSFVIGAVGGLIAMMWGKKKKSDAIPFGPALAAGAVAALFWGGPILTLYGQTIAAP